MTNLPEPNLRTLPRALWPLRGKRIVVLGLGREGNASLRYLRSVLGRSVTLDVADQIDEARLDDATRENLDACAVDATHFGDGYLEALAGADVILRAPGIPPWTPAIEAAVAHGALLTSNSKLFFAVAPGTVIGVTGTKGKSTTTSLIAHVLQRTGLDVRLGGNIGIAPTELLAGATAATVFVLELSCHQLTDLGRSPLIAVVQDVVPEHLDYYRSFEEYVRAKQNIVLHQRVDDLVVFNSAYEVPRAFAASTPARRLPFSLDAAPDDAAFLQDGRLVLRDAAGDLEPIIDIDEVPLAGRFNLQNVLPALLVGRHFGLDAATMADAVRSFRGLPHRLELVASVDGVCYYNDSLATVPEATIGALDAFAPAPVVLIAGGFDRGQDYRELAERIVATGLRGLVLLPGTGAQLRDAVEAAAGTNAAPTMRDAADMDAAVTAARDLARPGDVVLLSPAAASFGVFRDYADRGERFRDAVAHLQAPAS